MRGVLPRLEKLDAVYPPARKSAPAARGAGAGAVGAHAPPRDDASAPLRAALRAHEVAISEAEAHVAVAEEETEVEALHRPRDDVRHRPYEPARPQIGLDGSLQPIGPARGRSTTPARGDCATGGR